MPRAFPGQKYVVIQTNKDAVVTPYTNAFLSGPNVKNILIQDQCPADGTGRGDGRRVDDVVQFGRDRAPLPGARMVDAGMARRRKAKMQR